MLTIPNLLSLSRIAAAPALLWLAWTHRPSVFIVVYALTLLSDFADGFLARRMRTASILGARLDSAGDLAMMLSMPVGALWLWPAIVRREAPFIAAGLASYFVPTIVGIIKYGRPTSYHTWGAKIAAVLLGVALLPLLLDVSPWPFRALIPLAVAEAIDELAMTAILRDWHANVPSSWHAWRLRQQERPAKGRS